LNRSSPTTQEGSPHHCAIVRAEPTTQEGSPESAASIGVFPIARGTSETPTPWPKLEEERSSLPAALTDRCHQKVGKMSSLCRPNAIGPNTSRIEPCNVHRAQAWRATATGAEHRHSTGGATAAPPRPYLSHSFYHMRSRLEYSYPLVFIKSELFILNSTALSELVLCTDGPKPMDLVHAAINLFHEISSRKIIQ
jgi:hypothetical protein